jgi:hypothetical protein
VTALSDLLDAQNAFLSMRVGFDVLRLVLDFECGTMKLNSDGLWVDPGTINRQILTSNTPRWTTLAQAKSPVPASAVSFNFRQVAPSVR